MRLKMCSATRRVSIKAAAAFFLGGALIAGAQSARCGEICGRSTIEFQEIDFSASGVARKPWVINRTDGPDTEVWEINGRMRQEPKIKDGRILHEPHATDGEVVWKVEAPANKKIKEFLWAFDALALVGLPGSDDQVVFEYSADNVWWVEFFRVGNQSPKYPEATVLKKQVLKAKLADDVDTSVLFIKLRHVEGPNPKDDAYFALWSTYGDGGENPNSYVRISLK